MRISAIITNSVVRTRSLPESPKRGAGPFAAAGIMSIALPAYRRSAAHHPKIRCAHHLKPPSDMPCPRDVQYRPGLDMAARYLSTQEYRSASRRQNLGDVVKVV